jgi:hypothetical protein
MLSRAAISRYQTEGFLFPLRAFAPDVAAAYRADIERTCAESSEAAAAFTGTVSYRVKPYLLFTWAADLVREPAILNAVGN